MQFSYQPANHHFLIRIISDLYIYLTSYIISKTHPEIFIVSIYHKFRFADINQVFSMILRINRLMVNSCQFNNGYPKSNHFFLALFPNKRKCRSVCAGSKSATSSRCRTRISTASLKIIKCGIGYITFLYRLRARTSPLTAVARFLGMFSANWTMKARTKSHHRLHTAM